MSRHQLDVQLYVVAPEWNEELDHPPRQLAYDPLGELIRALGQSAAKTLATDQRDGDELAICRAFKMLPPDDLVRVVDAATELLASRPPDRTGELRALAETRVIVASAYQQATAAASEGRATSGDLERLGGRLTALDTRRTQLEQEQDACLRWDQDHAPQLRRAEVASQELAARHAARLAALEHDPPAHLAAKLGRRPSHPVAAQTWRHSVAAIERSREINGVDDPELARDPDPAQERRAMANELVVTETAAAALPPGPPPGIERTDDLALGL
jgi:hypothetical protein